MKLVKVRIVGFGERMMTPLAYKVLKNEMGGKHGPFLGGYKKRGPKPKGGTE